MQIPLRDLRHANSTGVFTAKLDHPQDSDKQARKCRKIRMFLQGLRREFLTQYDGVPGCEFVGEPENFTVEQLRRWLKCRDLKQAGKREVLNLAHVSDCLN